MLAEVHSVIESSVLAAVIEKSVWSDEDWAFLHDPTIALWCPLRHQNTMLGLLILGLRHDLDPYHTADQQARMQVLTAATLAFANSATYTQQQEAERLVRQLRQRLQTERDTPARSIANDLHDEIITGHIKRNIDLLQRILNWIDQAWLREEIEDVLHNEQTLIGALRRICNQLYPAALDEPFGLPAVLREPIQQAQARWGGTWQLVVTGPMLAVSPSIQGKVLRITREALTNTAEHAHATEVVVQLIFQAPPEPGDS